MADRPGFYCAARFDAYSCPLSLEDESCGQCAPCRIGTFYLRTMLDRHVSGETPDGASPLGKVADASWQMNEGSICGLGQAASLPLTTAMQHWPEEFAER